MSRAEVLNKAKVKKDDEFYTYLEDVKNIFNYIIDPKLYRIILPFNDELSNFKYYCKKNELNHEVVYNDYKNHMYRKNDLVVSNPPFSILREIVDYYMDHNIKFLLIIPLHSIKYRNIFNYWKQNRLHFICYIIRNFIRPDGRNQQVPCYLLTNLPLTEFWEEYWIPKKSNTKFDFLPDNKISFNYLGQDYLKLMKDFKDSELYFSIRILFTKFAAYNRDKIIKTEGKLYKPGGKQLYFERVLIKYEE